MQQNILSFLNGLPSGRLELAYENLIYNLEATEPVPPTLLPKEDMVSRLTTFRNEDVLMALLNTENQQSYSVKADLIEYYRQYHCINSATDNNGGGQPNELLQQHNSYAHQMNLLEQFAINTAWLEEPLERIIGVFSQEGVQFLIDTNQTHDSPGTITEVRASKSVSTSALDRFATLASNRYPDEFQTEYCRNIYHSNHYEHPVQMIFSSILERSKGLSIHELDLTTQKQWDDAIQNLCTTDVGMRIEGRDKLIELIMVTPSLQRTLSHLVQNKNTDGTSYPIFERELCSSKSLFSALWLFAYFDISLETVETWDVRTYEALMASARELFNPILNCVYQSTIQSATVEN